MPNTKVYRSSEELVEALRATKWQEWFAAKAQPDRRMDDLIKASVASNTFRAFRNLAAPSKVFRKWAGRKFTDEFVAALRRVQCQRDFDRELTGLAKSLRGMWTRSAGKEMVFGPSMKLPSLVLKFICARDFAPTGNHGLVTFLHVPLDSYTLAAIREVHNAISQDCRIPATATMGWVKNPRDYESIQTSIRTCTSHAGVPAIAFDILVWDSTHPATKR